MKRPDTAPRRRRRTAGFTLVELLVVVTIIAILSSLVLGALWGAMEQAREARTRALVRKLNTMIMLRWESFATRRVPVDLRRLVQNNVAVQNAIGFYGLGPANPDDSRHIAVARLMAIRELMCMEMPDRFNDVTEMNVAPGPLVLSQPTSISRTYFQRIGAAPSNFNYQNAECLYGIIAFGLEDELALDQFKPNEIGDKDGDGLLEFHDGWGNPVRFLRWAPGFISELQPDPRGLNPLNPMTRTFSLENHDPFDPLRQFDIPPTETDYPRGFALVPLVYSAGPDGSYDIRGDHVPVGGGPGISYRTPPMPPAGTTPPPYNPYIFADPGATGPVFAGWIGAPADVSGLLGQSGPDGSMTGHFDNIHNHQLDMR